MKVYLASPHSYPGMIAEQIGGGTGEIFCKYGDKAAMKVYMAGGIGGNLKPFWGECCKQMKAGLSFDEAVKAAMGSFLAAGLSKMDGNQAARYISGIRPFILESFYYIDSDTERLLPYFGDFLLDSGVFTFMQNAGTKADWDDYTHKYAEFVRRNNIEKYIEMDLDYVIGIKGARRLRSILEEETGRKSIPVWHPIRGKDSFLEMCEEYDYVALGGIVGQKWRGVEQYMPWFINEAHKRGAKIHGLGFTRLTKLKDYHFDSVDSTSWTTGNRFGALYQFNGETVVKKGKPAGYKLADSRAVAVNNFCEWVKFQMWADTHL